jgi:hypothetical protein
MENEKFNSKKQIAELIVGDAYTRSEAIVKTWMNQLCSMLETADEQGSFIADIIDKVISNQRISTKQAWAVAYWAEKNGYVN